jgi:hypothetical protein
MLYLTPEVVQTLENFNRRGAPAPSDSEETEQPPEARKTEEEIEIARKWGSENT